MSAPKDYFSERMKRVVERAGSVADVARIAGVSTQSVYGWLAGSRPYRDRITRLCLHFGIREKWLWDGEGREEDDHTSARVHEPVAHYLPAPLSDDALASRLSDCILTEADCPPAFLAIALAEIDALYAEFRFRAAAKMASPAPKRGKSSAKQRGKFDQ